MKRIAVSRLRLSDGKVLRNQVLELQGTMLLRHYPLTEELHSTIWLDKEWSEQNFVKCVSDIDT